MKKDRGRKWCKETHTYELALEAGATMVDGALVGSFECPDYACAKLKLKICLVSRSDC